MQCAQENIVNNVFTIIFMVTNNNFSMEIDIMTIKEN